MDAGQMRALAQGIRQGRSDSTIAEYDRIIKRLAGKPWRTYADRVNASRRYGYLLKAADRYRRAGLVLDWLRLSDRARKAGDRLTAGDYRRRAEQVAHALQEDEAPYRPEAPKPNRKTSKRKTLAGLPSDWREQIIAELNDLDQFPAIILTLTGCRPAEFQAGIVLERVGEDLRATITGAKVSKWTGGGQESRTLVFDGADALASWLLAHVDDHGGPVRVRGDLGAWRKRFTRAAARLGFKKISPYSLRHQFAGDQKRRGWNDDRLSQALGQASARTRKHYGHARQGRGGGGGLKSVTATQAVRNAQTPIPGQSPAPTPEPIPTPTPVLDLDLDLDTGPSPE